MKRRFTRFCREPWTVDYPTNPIPRPRTTYVPSLPYSSIYHSHNHQPTVTFHLSIIINTAYYQAGHLLSPKPIATL